MSETSPSSEHKIEEKTSLRDDSGFTSKNDDLCLDDDQDKPINSFASMIYFKDKQYIKEEPSSPVDVECWKTDDRRSPHSIEAEEKQRNSSGGSTSNEDTMVQTPTVLPPISSSSFEIKCSFPSSLSSPVVSSSSKDSSGIPRKPLTPYMSYRNMIFEEIKHKYPGCSPYDLACLISSKWSMLTDSERKVWEDQYEIEMKKYSDALQNIGSSNVTSPRDWLPKKKSDTQPSSNNSTSKTFQVEEVKSSQTGQCKWCRRFTRLQDFTSLLDGREIFCTGLCSEKCFIEAAKQINSMEGSSTRQPRYSKYSSSTSSSSKSTSQPPSDDITTYSSTGSRYSSSSSHSPQINEIQRSKSTSLFDWDNYLSQNPQSTAAHWTYFKQARYPPPNNFVIGMKLEACSYTASNMAPAFSLATVVGTCGSRILLHFDGTDASSDIWRLPDSADIHPVGWTEGSLLKAPLGYKYDPAKYNKYFASNLQSAEIAPARLFKKEPQKPVENYFRVGLKLEAVNRQKPSIVGVASVIDVESEQVKIEFDGIKGLGYWCAYYDRDLFPAGWCARSGHPLQPPGNKLPQLYQRQSASSSSPPLSMTGEPRSPLLSSSSSSATPRESSSSTSTWKEKSGSPNSVEVFISMDCYCGPYIEAPKLKKLPRLYKGNMVTVLKNVLEDVIKCAIDPKTVFGFLKPGRGNCVIKAICDGQAYQCCLNSIDRVSTFWRVLEQFSDNLRCCQNMFSSTELRISCTRCNQNNSNSSSSHSTSQTRTPHDHVRSSHHGKRHYHHSSYNLHESSSGRGASVEKYETSRHDSTATSRHERLLNVHSFSYDMRRDSEVDSPIFVLSNSRKDSVFESNPIVRSTSSNLEKIQRSEENKTKKATREEHYNAENDNITVDDNDEPLYKKKMLNKRKVEGLDISIAPKTWSIDDVIAFMSQTDLKDYVERFRENEIDGKALLLLQRDLVLSHMDFKLGPAVKLLDMIEELKSVQETFQ